MTEGRLGYIPEITDENPEQVTKPKLFSHNDRVFFKFFGGAIAAFGLIAAGVVIGRAERYTAEEMMAIQGNNAQLTAQLRSNHKQVRDMNLSPGYETFKFESTDSVGEAQSCHGVYAVHHKVARVVGNVACQVTVPIK